ncbi:MAG: type I DNA topoisomerase [bacterium]
MEKQKYLVIVESPTKEKIIKKYLGKNYTVKSSYGHIRDLPGRSLGIDEEKDFEPTYVIIPKAKKNIAHIKTISEKSDIIYLATDFDREGEAIAWHLMEALKLDKDKFKRITFHEITPEAIKKAIAHPRGIDSNLVYSQQARRVLDRIVGYKLSPLLWKKIYKGLSAGRVQSVAVRLVCDREKEINDFKADEYWTVEAELSNTKKDVFKANLFEAAGEKLEKLGLTNKEQVDEICADLEKAAYTIKNIERKERLRNPLPPFITSTLQQESSHRLGFSASRTMMIAQSLYEGVMLPEGGMGLITYMRTDSLHVAAGSRKETAEFISEHIGHEYLPSKPRLYKTKVKGAQEAHEAIHPTSVLRTPELMKEYLNQDQFKLYQLIWQRFVASQMKEAVYDTVTVIIDAHARTHYGLRASGRVLKFPGFLKVYEVKEDNQDDTDRLLPAVSEQEKLMLIKLLPDQHFTEPPPRYNEASLIRTMESYGIGRPSTYAPTMKTIITRGYVRLEQRRFYPTELGTLVNDNLKIYFPEIVNVSFTARVEERLDVVAEGKQEWQTVILEFYAPFMAALKVAEKNMKKVATEPKMTDKKCTVCGGAMIHRFSRFGQYLSCEKYPACKNKISLNENGEEEALLIEDTCHKCGERLMIKMSRRGKFLACSAYPQCKTTYSIDKDGNKIVRPDPKTTDKKCEKCLRPMYLRVGKRGHFLACSGFPKCRNIKKADQETINTYADAPTP